MGSEVPQYPPGGPPLCNGRLLVSPPPPPKKPDPPRCRVLRDYEDPSKAGWLNPDGSIEWPVSNSLWNRIMEAMKPKTVTVAGVKFKTSEITSVTFNRDGHEVTVTPKQKDDNSPRIEGFKR